MAAIPGPSLSPAAGSNSEHFDYHFLSSQLVAKEKILPKRKFCPRSHRVLALSNFPSSQLIASFSGGFCLLGNSCHFDFSRKKTLKAFGSMVCRCRNESSFDPIDSSNDGGEWDFRSPYKQFQAAAGKMAEPFRHMMNIAGKKIQDYLEGYKGSKFKTKPNEIKSERDWEEWSEYFSLIEEHEKLIAILKLHLEDAVESEEFEEAARLKGVIEDSMTCDTVGEVMSQLKKAVEEERYRDAAQIRDNKGAGLVGWWAGLAEGANDPYGRIIHISPGYGRFVAKSYTGRQLAAAAPGVPLFEVFVTKDSDQEYKQQAVYLQQNGRSADETLSGSSEASEESEIDAERAEDTDLGDEGLTHVLKFVTARIPGLKFKVLKVMTPEQADTDIISGVFEQLMQEDDEEKVDETTIKGVAAEFKIKGDLRDGRVLVGDSDFMERIEIAAAKVALGTLLQSIAEDAPPRVPLRVPAKIENRGRDSFCFHIEDDHNQEQAQGKEMTPSWKVASISREGSADPMPPDVPKFLWNAEKLPVKVLKDLGEIITLAVNQAQKRRGLNGSTVFRRISIEEASTDPWNGLYSGTFGPHTSEVVQLRRRFGQWHDDDETPSKDSKLEFFEYVEAVKLTGDLNVPAGQVAFRAKIGKENQLPHREVFPEELGVIARYKGQERHAATGFRNPHWIDGELVLFDGKGIGQTNGPQLGFVCSAPERPILLLFNRLKLQ